MGLTAREEYVPQDSCPNLFILLQHFAPEFDFSDFYANTFYMKAILQKVPVGNRNSVMFHTG